MKIVDEAKICVKQLRSNDPKGLFMDIMIQGNINNVAIEASWLATYSVFNAGGYSSTIVHFLIGSQVTIPQNTSIDKWTTHGTLMPGVSHRKKSRFSKAAFYMWKATYRGMHASTLTGLREVEEENRRLKQMDAELSLDHKILKDLREKEL